MNDLGQAIAKAEAIKALGVRLALDDLKSRTTRTRRLGESSYHSIHACTGRWSEPRPSSPTTCRSTRSSFVCST